MGEDQHTIEEEEVTELTGQGSGCWQVITVQSEHRFDLDAGTVERMAGQDALILHDDGRLRSLRSIERCRVGGRGHWTLYLDNFLVEFEGHLSTDIVRIVRLPTNSRQL